MGLVVISLFDGESGGMMALKRVGFEIDSYYASEIEPNAIDFSKRNFPEIIHVGSVTDLKYENGKLYTLDKVYDIPKVDLLLGGSPCQGFSRQGKHLNFEDPRSMLFFEYVRILEEIKKENPNVKFLLENVQMKKEWKELIDKSLDVDGIDFNSDRLVPQNRPRTYWTNFNYELPIKTYSILDLLDDVTLEDYEEIDGYKICNSYSQDSKNLIQIVNGEVRIKQAVKIGYIVAENGDGINLSFPNSKTRRGRVVKGRSSCLDTSCNIGVLDGKNQIRPFTINELCKLQTVDSELFNGYKEKDIKRMLGNGWTIDVIAYILKHIGGEQN